MSKGRWHPEEEFFLKKINLDKVFSLIDKSEYMLIYYIRHLEERDQTTEGVYLAELASEMKLTIPEVSKIVQRLQDRGHIYWKTDVAKGRTYVQVTEIAKELMEHQKEKLTEYYKKIQEEIPNEDLKTTITTIYKISQMMSEEKEIIL